MFLGVVRHTGKFLPLLQQVRYKKLLCAFALRRQENKRTSPSALLDMMSALCAEHLGGVFLCVY